MLSIG